MTQNLPALLAATARVQKLRVLASLRGRFDHAYWSVSPKDVHFASQALASTLNSSTPVNLNFGFERGSFFILFGFLLCGAGVSWFRDVGRVACFGLVQTFRIPRARGLKKLSHESLELETVDRRGLDPGAFCFRSSPSSSSDHHHHHHHHDHQHDHDHGRHHHHHRHLILMFISLYFITFTHRHIQIPQYNRS